MSRRGIVTDRATSRVGHARLSAVYLLLPPATLASTEAVRRSVASDLNAIGYVPAAEVDASVRVVLRLE